MTTILPSRSRHMPFGLPLSVWGICQKSKKAPCGENFCTRPVMSTTYRLSCVSTATERGLLSSPTPTPREPIIWTRLKKRLSSEASFDDGEREQLANNTRMPRQQIVFRIAYCAGTEHATRNTEPDLPSARPMPH